MEHPQEREKCAIGVIPGAIIALSLLGAAYNAYSGWKAHKTAKFLGEALKKLRQGMKDRPFYNPWAYEQAATTRSPNFNIDELIRRYPVKSFRGGWTRPITYNAAAATLPELADFGMTRFVSKIPALSKAGATLGRLGAAAGVGAVLDSVADEYNYEMRGKAYDRLRQFVGLMNAQTPWYGRLHYFFRDPTKVRRMVSKNRWMLPYIHRELLDLKAHPEWTKNPLFPEINVSNRVKQFEDIVYSGFRK